jgi:hypothetical protein
MAQGMKEIRETVFVRLLHLSLFATLVVALCGVAITASAETREQLKRLGGNYDMNRDSWQGSGCTIPVWYDGSPVRAFMVPDFAAEYGFADGDYLVSIDGKPVPDVPQELVELLRNIPPDAYVPIKLYRSGTYLSITARCESATKETDLFMQLTDSLQQADAGRCLAVIEEFGEWLGGKIPPTMLFARQQCLAVANPGEYNAMRNEHLFELTQAEIEKYKIFPSQFKSNRQILLRQIATIGRGDEDKLTTQIEKAFLDAAAFIDEDAPPPTGY